MDFKFEIQGLKEIKELLKDLPDSVKDQVQADINNNAAKIVQKELQDNAPSGNNDELPKNKIENNIVIKTEKGSKTNKLVGFTKRVFHVKFIELGTKVRSVVGKKGKYKGANRGAVRARPFVLRSHQSGGKKAIDFMATNYLKVLHNSIKKQNKKVLNALKKKLK